MNKTELIAAVAKQTELTKKDTASIIDALTTTIKKELEQTHNPGDIIKKLMSGPLKKHGQEVVKLVPRYVKDRSKIPEHPLNQKEEAEALEQATKRFSEEIGAPVEVVAEEKTKHPKAKSSMPGKPAILIE